jgi:hypothetical protein
MGIVSGRSIQIHMNILSIGGDLGNRVCPGTSRWWSGVVRVNFGSHAIAAIRETRPSQSPL